MQLIKPVMRFTVALLSLAACVISSAQTAGVKADTSAAFDQFKGLAGDWTGTSGDVRFKVTSGGSAVEETYFPGTKMEMINMITRDGSKVTLVHYCMAGNQPRMTAPDKASGNTVAFKFVSAGNMKSDADEHMHNVTFIFVDADTVKERWVSYKDGKPSGEPVEFVHKRKKQQH